MSEQRGSRRSRVLKDGKISFRGGAISCTVRNVSDTGALLAVASPVGIPQEFTLVIPADDLYRFCRVVWRSGDRIGVRSARRFHEAEPRHSDDRSRGRHPDAGGRHDGPHHGRGGLRRNCGRPLGGGGGRSGRAAQRGVPADWHCHGCFSASVSVPVPVALARLSIAPSAWPPLDGFRPGLAAGVDPPPPRKVA